MGVVLWGAVLGLCLIPHVLSWRLVLLASSRLRLPHLGGCVFRGVGSTFSWCGSGLSYQCPPFLAGGLVGWVGVLGVSLPFLAWGWVVGVFVAWVLCRFCLLGVLLVGARGLAGAWGCGDMALGSCGWPAVHGLLVAVGCCVVVFFLVVCSWFHCRGAVGSFFVRMACGVGGSLSLLRVEGGVLGFRLLLFVCLCGGVLPLVRLGLRSCGVAFQVFLRSL